MSPYGETPKLFSLPQSVTNPSSATRCNGKPNNYFSDQNSVISVVDSEDEKDELRPSDIHVFSASSTLHGFNHIFASHHSTLRRFTWTVAFLTSLTLFLLQSSNRATYYLSYPHVTRLDEVTAGDLNFPSVTICNLNEFRFNKITTQDMYHAGSLLGILDDSDNLIKPSFYTNIENMEDGPTKDRLRAMKKKIDQLTDFDSGFVARGEFNMHEFYNRTSHDISEFLLGCKYRGRPCNHTWFTEVYDKQSMPSQNDEEIVSDLGSNKKKLSLMECPFKELSQRTSMKNINSQMTNGMCCEADRPSQEKQEPAKEKDKELKPSDFIFFASNSTFHGINHIFTSAPFSFRKLLWAMAVLSSLALCINQAYDRYIYYRSRPHVTKLDEQEALEMNFPAVTICNMNPFRLNAITTDDYYYAGREILRLFTNNYDTPTKFRDNRTWPIIEEKIKPIRQQRDDYKPKSDTFNMFEFYNRTGHTIKGMLKGCKYRGEGCLDKYWTQVYTRYGKCYTFNSGKDHALLKTLKGGIGNGLEILLDTEQDEYMPVWAETDEISIEAGFKVQIHAHTEPPFIHELGFSISPGFQTLVATQEQRITFLPKPYGNCISGVNKSRHYHYKNYSISACRITCETEFVVHECGCRMIHMPGNASFCSPETYKRCADKTLNFLEQEDETYCVCGTPCDVTRYNLESSTLQLPSTQALSYMAYKYKRSEEYLRNNFAKLNIFFEALNYETIEQKKAYEIPGLFGDIGGQMGLFIGASILTILELFDYLYEVIKWKIFGKPTGKSKHSLSSKSPKESSTEMEVLHYPQQQQHGIHDDMNNRTSYTNYSHIFSSPEFDCASKPFLETQTNFDESNSQLQHPVSQYFGNSLISPKENTMSENVCLPLTSPPRRMPLVYPSQMSPQQMQDTSLSYGDLYKKPENNWPGSNYQHQTSPPGWPYTDTMGTSNMGYSAASTTPVTSQSSVRQRIGESSMPNGAPQQQGIAPSSCPTYNMAIDLQDYPISIETDIN